MQELKRIRDGIYLLRDRITNLYFICGKEKMLLLDTGFGSYDLKAAARTISDLPLMVLNTHAHPDHQGGNNQFDKVYVSFREFDLERELGGRGGPISWELAGLKEGDIIDLGDHPLEVIEVPGHSPGSIALLDRKERLLFSGDMLQEGPIFMFVEGSNLDTLASSLRKLRTFADHFDWVYPAHNKTPVDPGYIDRLLSLIADVLAGIARPVSQHIIHDIACMKYEKDGVSLYH